MTQQILVEQHTSGESVDIKGYLKKQDLPHKYFIGRFRTAWQFSYIKSGLSANSEQLIVLPDGKIDDLKINVDDFISFKAEKRKVQLFCDKHGFNRGLPYPIYAENRECGLTFDAVFWIAVGVFATILIGISIGCVFNHCRQKNTTQSNQKQFNKPLDNATATNLGVTNYDSEENDPECESEDVY